MPEGLESYTDDREFVDDQYEFGAINAKLRWEIYLFTSTPMDFHYAIAQNLDLQGGETVLDIGCGDGGWLYELPEDVKKIGLEIKEDRFKAASSEEEKAKLSEIDFLLGLGEQLPFDDDSIDVLSSLFMLYHIGDKKIDNALEEIVRVLKPDGKAVIATSGANNKSRHREFERRIARFINQRHVADAEITPPDTFSRGFNSDYARTILPDYFDEIEEFRHDDHIIIDSAESYEAYIHSLYSMYRAFDPVPSGREYNYAIKNVVEPQIKSEINSMGFFTDSVDRSFFICRKR